MPADNTPITVDQVARIAVYDDLLSAPRIVDVQPADIATFIERIASKTYELAQAQGGQIPYTVIREVSENFIHARFIEPTISILDHGNTIRFADQGPGIANKDRVQLPGFTSATSEMKDYIRGVGSGLPIVKEYLKFSNGRLVIEDNIKDGTVITITVGNNEPVVYQEKTQVNGAQQPMRTVQRQQAAAPQLDQRDLDVLSLANDLGQVGPTDINKELGIPVSTAYRIIEKLEEGGLLEQGSKRKKILTDLGYKALEG